MKILFFTKSFYPNIGGVEKHVQEISKILICKKNKILVVTEENSEQNYEIKNDYQKMCKSDSVYSNYEKINKSTNIRHTKYKNIDVIYINYGKKGWFKKFRIWWQLWKNRRIIIDCDIVHCHDIFIWYLPFRFIYYKKPVYVTFHGYESYPIKKKAIIIRKVSEILSCGNICIGDFIKKWYGTKPTYVSYGAVRISNFQFPISNFKKESAVFFGRLDEQTGIMTYVDAVRIIRKKIPDFKFAIVGEGKFRKQFDKDFNVEGFKEDINEYLKSHRFAFVSRYLSILEALAAKKLVFAVYDNPVKEDYLKMSPFAKFIIITNSSSDLAKKVMYYLNHHKEEKNMVEEGYRWAKSQSWEKMVDLYLKLWNSKDS